MKTVHITMNLDWKLISLIVIVAIICGSTVAISNTTSQQQPSHARASTAPTMAMGAPDYDSGWFTLAAGSSKPLVHNLDTMNIFVYMIGNHSTGYEHQLHLGVDEVGTNKLGAYWLQYNSNPNSIAIYRAANDFRWDEIRVWIWSLEPTSDGGAIVTRGTDNGIYYRLYDDDGGTWNSWTKLPGTTIQQPSGTVINNALHILVIGTDNQFYHGSVDLATQVFSGWTWLSGASEETPDFTTIPEYT